jgi:MoxR-like ATPase
MSESRTVTSAQARKSLLKAFSKKRPLFLWGPPGIGKSELVESITQELGGYMIDLRLGQMEPTDIRGIPFYNKELGKMDWAPPMWICPMKNLPASILLWCCSWTR